MACSRTLYMAGAWFGAFACLLTSTPAHAQHRPPGGLSADQLRKLRRLTISAVVPDPPPAGFKISQFDVYPDTRPDYYYIVYRRARDGATLSFEGIAAKSSPTAAPEKPHGLFQKIGSAFSSIGRHSSTPGPTQDNRQGEQEERMSAVTSDSPVAGTVSFAPSRGCLVGTPDTSKGQIQRVKLTVSGCGADIQRHPETLTRAYRSVKVASS